MRFGLELMSNVGRPERAGVVDRSLNSLVSTNVEGLERPVFFLTYGPAVFDYEPYLRPLREKFEVVTRPDPPGVLSYGICVNAGYAILEQFSDVTHVIFLWDDFVYNPEWLREMAKLIGRHPDARAWAVYRSRYTRHHKIVGSDENDVMMSMHDGIGCVSREEWLEYGKIHNGHDFYTADGCTPDIHHAEARPGERWATNRDFMQNLGRHVGIEDQDCAIDFVGE